MKTPSMARPGYRVLYLLAAFAVAGGVYGGLAEPAAAQGDPGSWRSEAPMPTPRRLLAAAVEDGAIYTFGGCGSPCYGPPFHTSTLEETRLEVFEGGSWSVRKPIPAILFGAAAAPGNKKIYVFGGFVTGSATYEYDPKGDSWSRKAAMPTPRHGLAAVAWDSKIYVLGGSNGSAATGALEVYDPKNDSWSQEAPPMPTPRVFLAAAVLNGKIYAIGGSPDCCGNGRTDAVEVYDTKEKLWSRAESLPVALQVSAAAAMNGKIYAFGGFIPGSGVQGSTFEYDPERTDKKWVLKAAMLDPRDQAPAVVLEGIAHVVGGSVDCHCQARGTHDSYTPPMASLQIRKESIPSEQVSPGQTLRYIITVTNQGPDAVSEATVTDNLEDTGLQDVLWCRDSGCTPSRSGNLHDTVRLPAGGTVTYEVTGTVPCACGETQIDNTACVMAPGQPEACSPKTTVPILPAPQGNLALSITGPGDLRRCGPRAYTFTVRNQGAGIACGAVLRVEPPAGSETVSISGPCTGLPCSLGNMAPGSRIQVTAAFSLPEDLLCPATLRTTASVSACDSARSTIEEKIPCVLSVTKSDGLETSFAGDLVLYTIGVTNLGCAAVSKAKVEDPFPTQLESVRWCRGKYCTPSLSGPLVDFLDLPAGGRETYRAVGTVSLSFIGNLINTVSVSPPESEIVRATDETRIASRLVPSVTTSCEALSGASFEGGMITNTFVIHNQGLGVQKDNPGPEFEDVLPAGLTLVSASADPNSGTVTTVGNIVRWNGSIPSGGRVTVTITAMINPGTLGMKICNGATVFFDSNGDGLNESSRPAAAPCCLQVLPVALVPSLSGPGLVALILLLCALALARLRRRDYP